MASNSVSFSTTSSNTNHNNECPSCGSVEVESEESMSVCSGCGTLVDSQSSLVADKSGFLTFAPHHNTSSQYSTSTASSNSSYVSSRREIIRFAEANVSEGSRNQVLASVKRIVAKGGLLFKKEAVAAAAAYHVLRKSSSIGSSSEHPCLKDFSLKFGANIRDIQRILKSLPPLEPPKEDNYVTYIRDILQYGEFWDASGSGIDNESMIKRVVALARLIGRPFLSQEFVLASSIVLYRAEAWNVNRVLFKRRIRCSIEELLGETGLLHSSLNSSKVSLETRNILKKCKELVRKLPYVISEEGKTRSLKSGEIYYYIDDLIKHSDLLLYSTSNSSIVASDKPESASLNTPTISYKRPCDENESVSSSKAADEKTFKRPRHALMTKI